MMKLDMISSIIFGFVIFDIVRLLWEVSLIVVSFSFCVNFIYGKIFVQLGLKIIFVDDRHKLFSLT